MQVARVIAYLALIPMLASCAAGTAFNPAAPSGVIVEQLVGQSSVVQATSLSSPLQVNNGFSLALSEQHYSDVFTATILSYTGALPDYTVAMDSSGKVAVFTAAPFSPGHVDSVQFRDVRGNTATVFIQNVGTSSTASAGTVVASLPGTTAALSSSLIAPIPVTNSFSIDVQETGYSGLFTAAIVSYTAPTTAPCYAISGGNSTVQPSVFTFTPQNSPSTNGTTGACSLAGDIEGVRFSDSNGNSTIQYFSSTPGSGIVVASLPGTTAALSSSLIAPIPVTNSFSIDVQETGYSGLFKAAIISYTAPTTAPCYAISGGNSTVQPSVFTFTPQNPPSINGTTGACSLTGDIEGVRFSDSNGNSTIQYFSSTPAPGSVPTTVSKIVLSWIGSVPTNGVCGTYQLKVQAYDTSGAAITTAVTYTYPITLSIAGANNTALITTTAPGVQTPCSAPPNAATTLGITTSSSPVYVFVNGLQVNGATTLTATAFGVSAANIGQLTF